MRDEFQQQVIEDSVVIDDDLGQAIAYLAFVTDPEEGLGANEHIAIRRLKILPCWIVLMSVIGRWFCPVLPTQSHGMLTSKKKV